MTGAGAVGGLVVLVGLVLWLSHRPAWQRLFRWLPVPLWCYALPALATTLGWLPARHPAYRTLTDLLLPLALALLLLGVDLPSIIRTGRRALIAAVIGALAIVIGAPLGVWLLQSHLPVEAWKGAGALAGTWTGGTMNLLALRALLDTPEAIFTPLILVDALMAYSWMALLVAASSFQPPMNRWLRAEDPSGASNAAGVADARAARSGWLNAWWCAAVAVGLTLGVRALASRLPTSVLIGSAIGWTVFLITTVTLGLSLIPWLRRVGAHGSGMGYAALYLVLAATGAQASVRALWSAPAWIVVGVWVVLFHGAALLLAGRAFRIPISLLATASQANIGGLVSAPLVAAVYHRSLAPVGLLLAMAGNALGTYLGWGAASLCRLLLGGR